VFFLASMNQLLDYANEWLCELVIVGERAVVPFSLLLFLLLSNLRYEIKRTGVVFLCSVFN
jgi:hypothetical protein